MCMGVITINLVWTFFCSLPLVIYVNWPHTHTQIIGIYQFGYALFHFTCRLAVDVLCIFSVHIFVSRCIENHQKWMETNLWGLGNVCEDWNSNISNNLYNYFVWFSQQFTKMPASSLEFRSNSSSSSLFSFYKLNVCEWLWCENKITWTKESYSIVIVGCLLMSMPLDGGVEY